MSNLRSRYVCGTNHDAYIWFNSTDCSSIGYASLVWICMIFSILLTMWMAYNGDITLWSAFIIYLLVGMAAWSHTKTMFSDPGSVPITAMPLDKDFELGQILCGRCECYKPPFSHHGRFILYFINNYTICLTFLYRQY